MTETDLVMTVEGPMPASRLGPTLPHEHLFLDTSSYLVPPSDAESERLFNLPVTMENLDDIRRSPYGNKDDCIVDDVEVLVDELTEFRRVGGGTICDITPAGLARDLLGIRDIGRRARVNVVAGCGYYLKSAQPPEVRRKSEEELAAVLVDEIRNGVDDTGIRPGVIGEIGTGLPVEPEEVKVLRAAALAQQETGLAVTVHVHPPGRLGHDVLDVLEEAGADLTRVVLGHLDASLAHPDIEPADALDYQRSLADRGCYVEYDLCGNEGPFATAQHSWWLPSDRERVKALKVLVDESRTGQLLLSQDVGHKHYLRRYGGWGYGHVLRSLTRYMRDAGIDDDQITQITTGNPQRMLAVPGLS